LHIETIKGLSVLNNYNHASFLSVAMTDIDQVSEANIFTAVIANSAHVHLV